MNDIKVVGFAFLFIGMLLSFYCLIRPEIFRWFVKKDFTQITFDGQIAIVRPGQESAFLDDDYNGEFKIEKVRMTERQFDNLPEFAGW